MHVPDWLVTLFDMKIYNKGHESDVDELIEMHVDLETRVVQNKNIAQYGSNINPATKYPKLRAAAEPVLLALPTSYMAEAGLSHVTAILTKQRNRLNLHSHGDL